MRFTLPAGMPCLMIATLAFASHEPPLPPPLIGDHPVTEGMQLRLDDTVSYSLIADPERQMIFLTGLFQIGIVSAFEKLLAEYPQTRGLVLNSEGGNIYQARGIAAVVLEHSLDTYVEHRCFSACVIPYVAGTQRFLVTNSSIGFHTYRLEMSPSVPTIDIEAEQNKDLAFFGQQIPDDQFVSGIFDHSQSDLWQPDSDELLSAGVVHQILPASWR